MIKIELSKDIKFKLPESRSEVTYDQWIKAHKHLKDIEDAQALFEKGEIYQSNSKVIRSIAKMIVALSVGNVTETDLLNTEWEHLFNLFNITFKWMQIEPKKKEFKVNGKTLVIPDFNNTTGLQLMDATAYIQQIEEDNDIEKGLVLATVYTSEKYTQDLEDYEKRKQWLKKYARMDLFHACAFFFLNSTKRLPMYTPQPLVVEEAERLIKPLNDWATMLYLLTYRESKSL